LALARPRATVSPNDIQEQLGQADPRTTAGYCRAQIHDHAKALEKIDVKMVEESL
jgi:hypothetical protein